MTLAQLRRWFNWLLHLILALTMLFALALIGGVMGCIAVTAMFLGAQPAPDSNQTYLIAKQRLFALYKPNERWGNLLDIC